MNKLKRFLALVLAMSMMLTAVPFGVFAAEAPTTNLSTTGSPFQAGTGGSNSFRIPAMVTLSDGTLVAAADARWNTTYDGGGLDTMVAVSADNGATWTHSFANYLGDNGNVYDGDASTCFIDPALAVKKANGVETIYMLCDLYPYGVALNGDDTQTAPSYDTGFDSNGNLILTDAAYASYYLKDGKIYDSNNSEVSGYDVDEYFNITGTDGTDSNLFFSDSPFKVARTGFLYLTKSTDKGATWSAPQLLNLKTGNEMVCLVGPGRGLVTYDGTIMFPVYSYNGENAKYTALVYSKDNGATWTRTANFDKEISSEAALVELTSGAIRVFFRNENSELTYTDYIQGLGFGDAVTTGVKVNSDTQLSAISYSKTVNGNQVILVSAPAGPNAAGSNNNNGAYRSSGKIFCGIADGSANLRTMTWKTGSVAVTPVATGAPSGSTFTAEQGFFAYSCLTERKDNSVSILYEDSQQGWGENCSYTMAYKTYTEEQLQTAFGVTFDGNTPEEGGEVDPNAVQVTLKVGQTTKVTDSTGAYVATTVPNANIVDMKLTTVAGNTEASVSSTKATALEDGATYIIRVLDTNYALTSNQGGTTWADSEGSPRAFETFTAAETDNMWTLEASGSGYKLKCAAGYLNLGKNAAWLNDSGEVFTLTPGDNGWTISDGTYNMDALGGLTAYRCAGGWENAGTRFDLYKVTPASNGSTEITFTGVSAGKTTAVVGNTTYSITVEALNAVDVTVKVGDTATYTINGVALNGNHSDDVADVTWTAAADNTTVTIKGKAAGSTKVTVGETVYNITVIPANVEKTENVTLNVGQTLEYIDNSGAYDTATVDPDGKIVEMTLTDATVAGEKKLVEITSLDQFVSGKSYFITSRNGQHVLTDETYSSTSLKVGDVVSTESTELWTFTGTYSGNNGYYTISRNGKYLNIANGSITMGDEQELTIYRATYNGETHWIISDGNSNALNNSGQNNVQAVEWDPDAGGLWRIYELVEEPGTASTKVSFTGKATGTTTAVVGNTLYNITVSGTTVDIELEVGENFTYTDTTGVYGDADITTRPDETRATMAVTNTNSSTTKKLVPVTAATFNTGKRYVIQSVRAADSDHAAYQPDYSVLTSTEAYGGLLMNGPLDVASSQTWSFTPSDNMYLIARNGEYINITNGGATMESTSQELSLQYVDGSGWLIYYNADGNNESNNGDYFLSDLGGKGKGEAYGYATKNDDGNYWNIYELVEEHNIDSTKVTFTGVAEGNTTAVVGGTVYNITVVPAETDDEVMNSATNTWTVDAEVQWQRYNALIGLAKDLYSDSSWRAYETARQAAYKQLVTITNASYATEAEATAALAEATRLVNELQTAYNNLVPAKTISVRYKLGDTVLDTREYKIASTDTALTLPDTIVVGDYIYEVTVDSLDLQGETGTGDTAFDVAVTLAGKVGGGFVASQDIDFATYHNGHRQICDLVDDTATVKKKITEMTLTVGTAYDVDLATDTTGRTVEWSVEPDGVATVDQDGNVTAVGTGTTTLTAVIKDADGNIVEINSMPITVYAKGTGDRKTAFYIEDVDNTTVWCVVNANTNSYAFEVVEGELIYGQFDTTVSDYTETTAFSFFGDPDEAHALVYMKSTNSDDHYFLLHDDDGNLYDGTVTANEAYYVSGQTSGAGHWQALGLNGNIELGRWDRIKTMVQWAINQGCDGGLGFTRRRYEVDLASNLTFASDPMPRIEKTVNGVLPTSRKQADFRRYTDGMVAAVHELVYFQITITQEVPSVWNDADETVGAIEYTGAKVIDDVLQGAYLYTKELDQADGSWDGEIAEAYRVTEDDINEELNSAWTAAQKAAGVRTFNYYLLYEIQESDIPKFYIDNIAELEYNYDSKYSAGAQKGTADAEARISVVGTAIDNVVIDFGQSFVYKAHEYHHFVTGQSYTFEGLSNTHLKFAYVDGTYLEDGTYVAGMNDTDNITASKAIAKYGTVKVYRTATGKTDDKGYPGYTYTVEYTPTQILQGIDTVQIYGYGENNREKIINGFMVYPATTVYYEEGFILNNASTWSSAGSEKATVNQTFELLGHSQFDEHGALTGKVSNKKHAYGYDPIYNGDGTNDVAKSSITSSTVGEKTTFTFTGNGFEIFANSKNSTGHVSVQVKNSAGQFVKVFTVNTVASEGYTGVTAGQTVNLDSLPIVSWHTDIHDTYTVTVQKILDTKPVVIDGVRIFNTVDESEYMTEENVANSPFLIDREDNPAFYQLRDHVLLALNIDNDTSVDYRTMCDQVYELMGDGQHAVILDAQNPYNSKAIVNRIVYTRTTTKTTVTITHFTDGTYLEVTRTDTTLEEYLTEARQLEDLLLTRTYTDETTQYFNANGTEVDRAAFGDPAAKVIDSEEKGETVVNTEEGTKTVLTSQDLLDNGPKNELYLHPGESLVFKVQTSRVMQLGLKAPNGETSYTISGASDKPISGALKTSVDMFYELGNAIGTETAYTITVQNTGDKILSVTDLKICDDPNAAFEPLTKEDIASVLQAMGYGASCDAGHTYKDGFCAVCGLGTARNTTTGTEYASVGDALAAAQAGETVIVLTDCTEGTIMVTPGITLDLNGCKLTVSYAVTMDSADIIDTVGTGCLVTGMKSLVLDESNAMIPVYTGEGYVFTSAGFAVRQDTSYTGNGVKIKAMAYPTQMAVVDLLKDGGADNNIEIVIRLTWDTDQGTGSQDFKFSDEVVATVFGSNNGTWNSYGKMFTMVITGTENIENLKATILVVSGTDAEYVSNKTIDIT